MLLLYIYYCGGVLETIVLRQSWTQHLIELYYIYISVAKMLLEKTISYGCLNGVVCLFYLTVLNLNPAIGKRPYNTLIWFLKPPSI